MSTGDPKAVANRSLGHATAAHSGRGAQGAALPHRSGYGGKSHADALLDTCDRLRRWRIYFDQPKIHRRKMEAANMPGYNMRRTADGSSPPSYMQIEKDNLAEKHALHSEIARYYGKHAPGKSIESDLAALKSYLAQQAQHIGLTAIAKRRAMIDEVTRRYENPTDMNSLCFALSVVLAYRTNLPLCLSQDSTVALSGNDQVDLRRTLLARENPDTETEVRSNMSRYIYIAEAARLEQIGQGDGSPLTTEQQLAVSQTDKVRRAKGGGRDYWTRRNDNEINNYPFTDKSNVLRIFDGHASFEDRYRAQVQIHPIIVALNHSVVNPIVLANILRMTDIETRNIYLRGLLAKAMDPLETDLATLTKLYKVENPEDVDFGTLRPALEAAAAHLGVTGKDDLQPALELCYYQLGRLDDIDLAEIATVAVTVTLLCATFYFLGPASAMVAVIGRSATVSGLAFGAQRLQIYYQTKNLEDRDKIYADMSQTIRLIEGNTSRDAALLGIGLEILGALPYGRLFGFINQAAKGPGHGVALAAKTRRGNLAPPIAAPPKAKVAPVNAALDPKSTAAKGVEPKTTGTPVTAVDQRATVATAKPPADPDAPRAHPSQSRRTESRSTQPEPVMTNKEAAERIADLPDGPRTKTMSESDIVTRDVLRQIERNKQIDAFMQRHGLRGPDEAPHVSLDTSPTSPESIAAAVEAERAAAVKVEKYLARNGFEAVTPDPLVQTRATTDITAPAARATQNAQTSVAQRATAGDLSLDVPDDMSFAELQPDLLRQAVAHGARLDQRQTSHTIRNAYRASDGARVDHVLNIDIEVIDVGDLNGVPSVVHRIRFRQAEFDALGIGNYTARFSERYAQANEMIAFIVDQTDAPPMLLPSAVKNADLKPKSTTFRRHLDTGSGFRVNIDESQSRFLDGPPIDLNQRVESDLINGIYSTADRTVAQWARDVAGPNATIGYAGVIVEF